MADDEPRQQGEESPTPTAASEGGAKLALCMVLVQLLTMGMILLSELALKAGMNPFVLVVYRNLVAAAAVAPFALIYERYVGYGDQCGNVDTPGVMTRCIISLSMFVCFDQGDLEKGEFDCLGMDLCKCCIWVSTHSQSTSGVSIATVQLLFFLLLT
jgi:hypothetical protein